MFNIEQYRRHMVNSWSSNPLWEKVVLILPDNVARYYREGMSRLEERMGLAESRINHPLVNSGDAYWTNNTTLCLGYKLISNNEVFRPIFSHGRQDLINGFQKNIQKGVLKREEKALWLELVRIKRLPIEIVDTVFEYVVMADTTHIFGKLNLADLR
jgi:hypothetical protein